MTAIVKTVLLIIGTPVFISEVTEIYFSVPVKPLAPKSVRIPNITCQVSVINQTNFFWMVSIVAQE